MYIYISRERERDRARNIHTYMCKHIFIRMHIHTHKQFLCQNLEHRFSDPAIWSYHLFNYTNKLLFLKRNLNACICISIQMYIYSNIRRAGRPQYDDEGDAYVLCAASEVQRLLRQVIFLCDIIESHVRDTTRSYVWYDSFACVIWLMCIVR